MHDETRKSGRRPPPRWLLWAGCGVLAALGGWQLWRDLARSPAAAQRAAAILEERQQLDETVWALEVDAQAYEATFVSLWDRLRAASSHEDGPFQVLRGFPLRQFGCGEIVARENLDWGIERLRCGPTERLLSRDEALEWLSQLQESGYRLREFEFHHARFEPATDDRAARSVVSFKLHVDRPKSPERWMVQGDLLVEWTDQRDDEQHYLAKTVSCENVTLLRRRGKPPFERWWTAGGGEGDVATAHPLLVYDIDNDGTTEVFLPRWNQLHRLRGHQFVREKPWHDAPAIHETGVLADFDGDQQVDFLSVAKTGNPVLFRGMAEGGFSSQPRVCGNVEFHLPWAITVGDVDRDGDLDAWVTQYKVPYESGQMPTPYYDANDGYPSFLLVNDGAGNFTDGTVAAGLEGKRHRRTYSSSFVDWNGDGNLDLVVVSDFSGLDIYVGDGQGRFQDVTQSVVDVPHFFGMSHTFGDFDADGRLDLYVIGMSSTTARRLERLGLGRPEYAQIQAMRPLMGYGNRLFLNRQDRFEQAACTDTIARTGWSWGCAAWDFDNDADNDIYVANGHRSGESAQDYCTTYWCHDIYTGTSQADRAVAQVLAKSLAPLNAREISWNGFEHNVLFMNQADADFVNVGYLMGVGWEYDARAVATEDLDRDGRIDLLVTEYAFDGVGYGTELYVYRNTLETSHHWIGVQLDPGKRPGALQGAAVRLVTDQHSQVRIVTTGDSFLTQHSQAVHFGLATLASVERIEVSWQDGTQQTISAPAVDRYHWVRHPGEDASPVE